MAVFEEILIIDDDELFLLVSKSIMEDEGFAEKIRSFEDGRDAIKYLKSQSQITFPEVIFLDINMPMMDGWEFIEEIEKLGIEKKMKIYITSSSINPLDLKTAEDNPNILGFISKPISPEKLNKIAHSAA